MNDRQRRKKQGMNKRHQENNEWISDNENMHRINKLKRRNNWRLIKNKNKGKPMNELKAKKEKNKETQKMTNRKRENKELVKH